jgi:hypothetical protein
LVVVIRGREDLFHQGSRRVDVLGRLLEFARCVSQAPTIVLLGHHGVSGGVAAIGTRDPMALVLICSRVPLLEDIAVSFLILGYELA